MATRVTTLKDESTYTMLIKLHLDEDPKHSTAAWNTSDLEHVVKFHAKFLEGVAATGCSINEIMLTKCLSQHFDCSPQQCKDFAIKMQQALSWCRGRCKPGRFSTGKKTAPEVQRVMSAIKGSSTESQGSGDQEHVDLCGPDTPPQEEGEGASGGDDALAALRKLQEAFGEDPISTTACSSRTKLLDPLSPISIASSSCPNSPAGALSGAAMPVQREVPGFFLSVFCHMCGVRFKRITTQ